jgi:hypothetical protein
MSLALRIIKHCRAGKRRLPIRWCSRPAQRVTDERCFMRKMRTDNQRFIEGAIWLRKQGNARYWLNCAGVLQPNNRKTFRNPMKTCCACRWFSWGLVTSHGIIPSR